MKVTVVTTEHKHGVNVRAFSSYEGAVAHLYQWVTASWSEVADYVGSEMPYDPWEAINLYFMNHDNESYVMDTVEVQP